MGKFGVGSANYDCGSGGFLNIDSNSYRDTDCPGVTGTIFGDSLYGDNICQLDTGIGNIGQIAKILVIGARFGDLLGIAPNSGDRLADETGFCIVWTGGDSPGGVENVSEVAGR